MQKIARWESCSENSNEFRTIAAQIEAELLSETQRGAVRESDLDVKYDRYEEHDEVTVNAETGSIASDEDNNSDDEYESSFIDDDDDVSASADETKSETSEIIEDSEVYTSSTETSSPTLSTSSTLTTSETQIDSMLRDLPGAEADLFPEFGTPPTYSNDETNEHIQTDGDVNTDIANFFNQ